MLADGGAHRVRVQVGALLGDDGRHHLLAPVVAAQPDDGRVRDPVDPAQRVLHLRRVHVEPARDDQLLDPVDDGDEAVLGHLHHVAGPEPAAREQHGRGLLGPLPVAGEDLRAADQQLARAAGRDVGAGVVGVDDAHLGRGERQAHRAGAPVAGDGVAQRDGRGLGHPVALDEQPAAHLLPGPDHVRGQGHRPGDAVADGGEVDPALPGGLGQARVHRRDGRQERGRAAADRGQHLVDVEAGEQHERRADLHGEGQAEREAVGVEQGQDPVDGLLAVAQAGHPRPPLRRVGAQVAVAQHRALGRARGAAGVLQQRRVLGRGPGRRRRQRPGGADQVVPVQGVGGGGGHGRPGGARRADGQAEREPLEPGQRGRHVDRDHRADRGVRDALLDGRGGDVPHHGDARAGVGELVGELGPRVQRVALDDDGPQAQDGVEGDDVLRAARHDEGDPVAGADPEAGQRRRGPVHLRGQVRVRGGRAEEVERHPAGEPPRGVLEQVDERAGGHLDVRGHALGVPVQPRPVGGARHARDPNGTAPRRRRATTRGVRPGRMAR